MRKELSLLELDEEQVELLPARETLYFNHNWANVWASNSSMALNAATLYSNAYSQAVQSVTVAQG